MGNRRSSCWPSFCKIGPWWYPVAHTQWVLHHKPLPTITPPYLLQEERLSPIFPSWCHPHPELLPPATSASSNHRFLPSANVLQLWMSNQRRQGASPSGLSSSSWPTFLFLTGQQHWVSLLRGWNYAKPEMSEIVTSLSQWTMMLNLLSPSSIVGHQASLPIPPQQTARISLLYSTNILVDHHEIRIQSDSPLPLEFVKTFYFIHISAETIKEDH